MSTLARHASKTIGSTITHCVPVSRILSLRHRILREGMPLEAAQFEGDDDGMTRHIATFPAYIVDQSVVDPLCCATFMWSEYEEETAWRLRGMATDTPYQGLGLGSRLLQWFEEAIIDRGPNRLMWCDARVPAVKFYESNGWQCVSGIYEIPTAGPHRKMIKRA